MSISSLSSEAICLSICQHVRVNTMPQMCHKSRPPDNRSGQWRRSSQLLECFGGHNRRNAFTKQRISHWIIDAITHTTRSVASSKVLARGGPSQDVCVAAGWCFDQVLQFGCGFNPRISSPPGLTQV